VAQNMLSVGLPAGSIIQYAYTVEDVEAGMHQFSNAFDVGPWFVTGPFTPPHARYRGESTGLTITIARAFVGTTMIELIQQHDAGPSVYRGSVKVRGHGFHHWAIGSRDLDADVARFGYPVVFEDLLATGARVVYVDPSGDLPGMIEIVELTPAQEQRFAEFHAAANNWDGSNPIRRV
jgi:hypothetical protein